MDNSTFNDLMMEQSEMLGMPYKDPNPAIARPVVPKKDIAPMEEFDKDGVMYSIDRFAKFGDIVE